MEASLRRKWWLKMSTSLNQNVIIEPLCWDAMQTSICIDMLFPINRDGNVENLLLNFGNMTKMKLNSIFYQTTPYIFPASNQLCYYFLEMKTCGNMPFPNLCNRIYGHKVECLWKLFVASIFYDPSLHYLPPQVFASLDNHAKLELCPKIKLNKSLCFLSFFSLPPPSHDVLYIFWQQTEEKYFHDFSSSMVFCVL